MAMLQRLFKPVIQAVLLTAALSGCSSDSDDASSMKCPSAAVLAPSSTLTTFRPELLNDPKGELYTIGVTQVQTDCDFDSDNGTTESSLTIQFRAKRAQGTAAASYHVPYYVAISQGQRVLSKVTFRVDFSFPEGATTTEFSDNVASTKINLENGKKPYDYEILVGLQLTHEQLDYNKKIGRFGL